MRKFLLSMILSLSSLTAVAAPANGQDTPELREKLSEEILEITSSKEQLETAMSQMEEMTLANLPSEMKATMTKTLAQSMSWDRMGKKFQKIYSDVFTAQEMQDILNFYKSPAGQNLLKKQPEITKKSMEMVQELTAEMTPIMLEEMKKAHDAKKAEEAKKPEAAGE